MNISALCYNQIKSKKILGSVRSQILSFSIIFAPITLLVISKETLIFFGAITADQGTKGIDIYFVVNWTLLASSIVLSICLLMRYNKSVYRNNGACCPGCNEVIDDRFIEIIVDTLECEKCKHKFTNDLDDKNATH